MSTRSPNYAAQARHLVALNRTGVLSTLAINPEGFPFGSITPYDIDQEGNITIYLSVIAEHYKNLQANPRASLTVIDLFGLQDPQAHGRATILLQFHPVSNAERAAVESSYCSRFEGAAGFELAHNFVFMRGAPERVRWIGGFGEVGWVQGDAFCTAGHAPITYLGLEILSHMNDDHRQALVELVAAREGKVPQSELVAMTDISSSSFTISVRGPEPLVVRYEFDSPVTTTEEARKALIEVLKRARQ